MSTFNKKHKNTHKNKREFGNDAEKTAMKYLKKQGLKLEAQNFYSRFGEIDLIMRDSNTWVFIEVRCREANAQVSPSESITPQKIHKIRKTATFFTTRFKEMPDCRFDVIAMTHSRGKIGYTIEWIKNAF